VRFRSAPRTGTCPPQAGKAAKNCRCSRPLAAMIGGGTRGGGSPMFGIRRRDLITLLGGAAAAWPLAARAQQSTMPVIGFLNIGSSRAFSAFLAAFHQGLNSAGYIEGRNVAIEYRWADGDFALLRDQANDLVRRNVTLIVATGGLVVARVAKDATNTIPLIFIGGGYPVEEGLVTSVNRPGGNASGVNLLASELLPKRLELLVDLLP